MMLRLIPKRLMLVERPPCRPPPLFFSTFPPSSPLPPSSPSSNNKLFVGGLSWSVDEKSLKDAFSSFGEVTEGDKYVTIHSKDKNHRRMGCKPKETHTKEEGTNDPAQTGAPDTTS